ncbi:MAG: protein TolQ [Acetobacterales bacterium]
MEPNAVEAASIAGTAAADLSVWGLFWQSDPIVKFVMLLLIAASVWCWAIIFDKVTRMRRLRREAEEFENRFWSGGSLEELFERVGSSPTHPMAAVFSAAMHEWRRATRKGLLSSQRAVDSLQERIERVMNITIGREMERLESQLGFLATVGSTAPFVGLFGTVWGIMNSFTAIAATKATNLAVVAPGIAEALFATALGLVAAIPAVVAYNKLASDLRRYGDRLEQFCGEFGAILSRQIDERS